MKKIPSIITAVVLVMALIGCAGNTSRGTDQAAAVKTYDVLRDGTYRGTGTGNNGTVTVDVAVNDGRMTAVTVADHSETKGLGDVAMDKIAAAMVRNNTVNVDAISGATRSSEAIAAAVTGALKLAGAADSTIKSMAKVSASGPAMRDSYTYDVVVVGAGGAGLAAAVEAAQAGSKVALLEKTMFPGGNTLVSGGGLNVPGSALQIRQGVKDTPEKFEEDTYLSGDSRANRDLVRVMAFNALDASNWLIETIHVEFMPDRLQQFGGHSVPRALVSKGNKGDDLINKLKLRADELGVDFFPETRATDLVKSGNAVTGVTAENNGKTVTFNAGNGVVIATGGFGANLEMRKKYNPEYDEKYATTCTAASTGDGMVMAEKAGARLIDMELIQVYPTCSPVTGIISYVANSRFDGAILVNQEGNRFVDEMGRRDVISQGIVSQTGSVAYLIWGKEIESVGNMVSIHTKEYETMEKDGVIYKANSIEDAARHYGIDPQALIATVSRFNGFAANGRDPDFSKGGNLISIKEGPFYIQKTTPSTHHTMGGIEINAKAQVLDTGGRPIQNLYAAGEVTGGIHGTNRLGGNAITDIIVFGRIAGQNVVK
ncbi:flavocytochrome c [Breznakiella homolactica]|uniref:Urocanate reductase n=1 Tax=Breznakiella homolactica TaxID=2798577 RepID=A0A7T7XN52_9SPIR|nr:flavocytochrome c [Breznakiella homolactica]QQO09414.1 flavocytochrome c [Breznakiella homolactica]